MSDDLNNLFVVRSPLQIINAVEVVEQFKLKNNILIIVYGKSVVNKEQMKLLIDMHNWSEVIHIDKGRKSKIFEYVKLIYRLKKYKYNSVVIGELGVVHKAIVANVKKEKVFLMDDGTQTLTYYDRYFKNNKINKYNFREMRFLLFGLKFEVKDKIILFTMFDLKPMNGVDVIKNEFLYLKKTYLNDAKKDYEHIYFLGQPLNRPGLMTLETYVNNLKKIIIKNNKKIIYIPHRSETQVLLDGVSSIDNSLLTIKRIDRPVELYFLENKIYPMHIISYVSTALTTLNIIFEECEVNFVKFFHEKSVNSYYEDVYKDNMILLDDIE